MSADGGRGVLHTPRVVEAFGGRTRTYPFSQQCRQRPRAYAKRPYITPSPRPSLTPFIICANLRSSVDKFSCGSVLYRSLGVVGGGRHSATATGPVGVEELPARPVHALVSMGAEEIALRLQQVSRQPPAAIPVVEGERRAERGRRDAGLDRSYYRTPPGILIVDKHRREEIVQKEVRGSGALVKRLLD